MKRVGAEGRVVLLATCRLERITEAAARCREEGFAAVSLVAPGEGERYRGAAAGIEVMPIPSTKGRLGKVISQARALRKARFSRLVIPLDEVSGDFLGARLVAFFSGVREIAILPLVPRGTTSLIPRWRLAAGIVKRGLMRLLPRRLRAGAVRPGAIDTISRRLGKAKKVAADWREGRGLEGLRVVLVCGRPPTRCRTCGPLLKELQAAGARVRQRRRAEYESDPVRVFEDVLGNEVFLLDRIKWGPVISWIFGVARRLHRATLLLLGETPPPFWPELALSSPLGAGRAHRRLSAFWMSDYIAPANKEVADRVRQWGKRSLEGLLSGSCQEALRSVLQREAAVARRMPAIGLPTLERFCRSAMSGRRFVDEREWRLEFLERCAVCGGEDWQIYLWSRGWQLLRCQGCDLICLNPRPSLDDLACYRGYRYDAPRWDGKTYLEHREDSIGNFTAMLLRVQRFQPSGRLLDVGCGPGFLMEVARRLGYEPYGVEVAEQGVAYAREQLGLQVEQGRFEETAYPESFFHAVMMSDLLEHMPDPVGSLVRAHRMLAADGVIDVSLVNAGSEEALRDGDKWFALGLPQHLFHFTPKTLSETLSRAGFEVVEVHHRGYRGVLMEMIARKAASSEPGEQRGQEDEPE